MSKGITNKNKNNLYDFLVKHTAEFAWKIVDFQSLKDVANLQDFLIIFIRKNPAIDSYIGTDKYRLIEGETIFIISVELVFLYFSDSYIMSYDKKCT